MVNSSNWNFWGRIWFRRVIDDFGSMPSVG